MTQRDPVDVLVVAEDPDEGGRLLAFLEGAGMVPFRCAVVGDLEAARSEIERRRRDVLVVSLGDADAALVREVRALAPGSPLVLVRPDLDESLAVDAVHEGAEDVLDGSVLDGALLRRTVLHAVERHRLARRFKEQEERLRQAQRMETVAVLAGGVAHDFNNLLTVIRGRCELAAGRAEGNAQVLADLGFIRVASDRAARLTRQLLTFSRRDVSRPRVLDINLVIEEMESLLRSVVGDSVSIQLDLGRDVGPVMVDPAHVEQVIVNLAVNARDAMEGGGEVRLETRRMVLDVGFCRIRGTLEPGPHTVLSVIDSGCGMDAETQARVFEPFFTTKPMVAARASGSPRCTASSPRRRVR